MIFVVCSNTVCSILLCSNMYVRTKYALITNRNVYYTKLLYFAKSAYFVNKKLQLTRNLDISLSRDQRDVNTSRIHTLAFQPEWSREAWKIACDPLSRKRKGDRLNEAIELERVLQMHHRDVMCSSDRVKFGVHPQLVCLQEELFFCSKWMLFELFIWSRVWYLEND